MDIKVQAELLQDAVNVIASAKHEKYTYAQVSNLLQQLTNCPQIEEEKEKKETKSTTKAKG